MDSVNDPILSSVQVPPRRTPPEHHSFIGGGRNAPTLPDTTVAVVSFSAGRAVQGAAAHTVIQLHNTDKKTPKAVRDPESRHLPASPDGGSAMPN